MLFIKNFKINQDSLTASAELATSTNIWESPFICPNPLFDISVHFTAEYAQMLQDLLQSTSFNLNGCLVNCSNKGVCEFDLVSKKYVCKCNEPEYIKGISCQTDLRACSSYPCLNNGTCVNLTINRTETFACECASQFFGHYCERHVDWCQNRTCSLHGYCHVGSSRNNSKCKCFTGFSGDDCELVDTFSAIIRNSVQYTSLLICVISMFTLAWLVVSNDVLNVCGFREKIDLKKWKKAKN